MNNDKNLVKGIEFKFVKFQDIDLLAIKGSDGRVYTSVRKVCEDLGVDFSSQLKRIKRDDFLLDSMVTITTPSNSGLQSVSCIDVEYLPVFLAGIVTEKCKEDVRPYLKEFKKRVRDILAKAFINPEITSAQPQNQRIPQSFSEALLLAGRLAQEVEEKEKRLQLSEPKAVLLDALTDTTELKTLKQIGYKLKPYGLGPNKIFKLLREEKVLTKANGENYPTHNYSDFFVISSVVMKWADKATGQEKSKSVDVLKVKAKFYPVLANILIKNKVLSLKDFQQIDFSDVPPDESIWNESFYKSDSPPFYYNCRSVLNPLEVIK